MGCWIDWEGPSSWFPRGQNTSDDGSKSLLLSDALTVVITLKNLCHPEDFELSLASLYLPTMQDGSPSCCARVWHLAGLPGRREQIAETRPQHLAQTPASLDPSDDELRCFRLHPLASLSPKRVQHRELKLILHAIVGNLSLRKISE